MTSFRPDATTGAEATLRLDGPETRLRDDTDMADKRSEIQTVVADYYTGKLKAYGETPRGVDWNSQESQTLRFAQLARVIDVGDGFSVNDFGCGYGAFHDYLAARYLTFSYYGCDVSGEMVRAARKRLGAYPDVELEEAGRPGRIADYGVASGIFNVRLGHDEAAWLAYIDDQLDVLDATSRLGFAFNCLTLYADPERMRGDLYYADPCRFFDHCKRRYSRQVALLHDYGLYEFTVLVRKTP